MTYLVELQFVIATILQPSILPEDHRYEIFPEEDLSRRLASARQIMKNGDLDALVVSVPENIYYLTGLGH